MVQYEAEKRVEAFRYFMGWRGGTIHQIAEETGISAYNLLNLEMSRSGYGVGDAYTAGWFGVSTCSRDWRVDELLPKAKGDWSYWCGVICAYWENDLWKRGGV